MRPSGIKLPFIFIDFWFAGAFAPIIVKWALYKTY